MVKAKKQKRRNKKEKVNVWKFDRGYKKPIYYLGIIGTILSGPLLWLIAGVLYLADSNNSDFKKESLFDAKHMKTNLQKLFYIVGWIDLLCILLILVLAMFFIMVGYSSGV